MLALIFLSLLIVSVLGVLGTLLVASTKSTDTTGGVFVAQYLLEKAKMKNFPPGGVERGVQPLLTHEDNEPVKFEYEIVWTLIGSASNYDAGGTATRTQFGCDLYHLKIKVWWMVENPDEGRAEGGGKRTISMDRIISHFPEN